VNYVIYLVMYNRSLSSGNKQSSYRREAHNRESMHRVSNCPLSQYNHELIVLICMYTAVIKACDIISDR